MRAISLYQPQAMLIVLDEKRIETRSWGLSAEMWEEIAGQRVGIHASTNFSGNQREFARTNRHARKALKAHGFKSIEQLPLGAMVGTVEIVELRRSELVRADKSLLSAKERAFGNYADRRWCWFLKNPVMFKTPIPCKGALTIWRVPPEIEAQILAASR